MSINYEIKEVVERIDGKLDSISERLIRVEDAQAFTNGKVKLNQKLIWGLAGTIVTLVGWLIVSLSNLYK